MSVMEDVSGMFDRAAPSRGSKAAATTVEQLSKWSAMAPVRIPHEDRLGPAEADRIWGVIYGLFKASGEEDRKEVKLAVYAYFAVNGSSPRGDYSQTIFTSGGSSAAASDVVQKIGKDILRKFLRAYPEEAYYALKGSKVINQDPVAVEKAGARGIPSQMAYLVADFFGNCPAMPPSEVSIYNKAFAHNLSRATAGRNGMRIEEVGNAEREVGVNAQRAGQAQESYSSAY